MKTEVISRTFVPIQLSERDREIMELMVQAPGMPDLLATFRLPPEMVNVPSPTKMHMRVGSNKLGPVIDLRPPHRREI